MAKDHALQRRDFFKTLIAGIPFLALDWEEFPRGKEGGQNRNVYDAIIIGSGLGGLSSAAAFARQNFRPLVLEQHAVPGGYATTFKRPGGFVFDVSLHSTTVGERGGLHNLIPGFPEIKEVEFLPHPYLYRTIFPGYDIRVPQKNPAKYAEILAGHFPEEKAGIDGIIGDMKGLAQDISKYSQAGGKVNMATFAKDYPYLIRCAGKTWGQMVDAWLKDPRLKAIVSSLWGYYGLPPSRLSSYYYALPTTSYLEEGGFYPRGRSQAISNALVKFIQERGGTVKLGSRVEKVLVRDHSATGVKTADGTEYAAKVIVANANPIDLFKTMMDENDYLKDYMGKFDNYSVSLSCFQVFLGLKKDLVAELKIPDSEVFYSTGFDDDASYRDSLEANVENSGFGLMLYDNVYKGYSPAGKNTINILTHQGYDHWARFEEDYREGRKEAYRAEKERMADILIKKVEETILPGLSTAIEIKEIGTPLTNWRYTRNYRGAIYGWDQTLNNSGPSRLPHATPIKNLFLAGAWTQPGHGYGAVIPSGLQCFAEIMKIWLR
ncbi:MAG: NAD(P)/FAD-dependent oxidoreductase [Acidobacteriota bacterium]